MRCYKNTTKKKLWKELESITKKNYYFLYEHEKSLISYLLTLNLLQFFIIIKFSNLKNSYKYAYFFNSN